MQKRLSLTIIIIGFCLIVGGIGSYYYEQYSNNDKMESCTTLITGSVKCCEQQTVRHFRRHGAGGWTEYFYIITYSYTVGGKKYQNRQRLTYQTGEHIDVHYDPDSPQKAYIGSTPQDLFGDRRSVAVLGGWVIFMGIMNRFIKHVKR